MQQQIQILHFNASDQLVSEIELFFCKTFNALSLESLHLTLSNVGNSLFIRGSDQASPIHKALYKEFDKGLKSSIVVTYRKLAAEWVTLLENQTDIQEWAVQRYPSLRVQFPMNISVFEFHRDSDYNHPLGEINHFLAITRCENSAALHLEQNLGWEDFVPLNLEASQSAIINTSIFKHGDLVNYENFTRVSVDFRAIPLNVLERSASMPSITTNKSFNTDDYFVRSSSLLFDD
jgi:hypothetical protein